MGRSKIDTYTSTETQIANWAKALAHPARIAIVNILIKRNACICGDIVDELPLSQSTVSQHLKELKDAGLIQGDIEGSKTCYCIHPRNWEKAQLALRDFFESYSNKEENCCG